VHGQPAEALLAELGELVEERRSENGTPGVAYGVVGDGAAFAAGSGVIGIEDLREVTGDTLFQLCSVTKPMTAALALGLVEEGLIGLDEPVATYLPELALTDPQTRNGLTLRHLLVHTSGLAGEWSGDLAEYGADDDALARLIADYPQLTQYAPLGAYWGYCNPGYWLAGRLIEVVTGVSFETAMRERLLAPLGMTEILFRSEDTTHRQVALPHKSSTNGQNPISDFSFPRARTASGGVLASTRDLLRFAAAALGTPLPGSKSVISENARAAMLRPAVPAEGPGVYQSIGWQVRLTEAGPLVHHGGSYTGYFTRLILAPTRGFAVAVLTNSDSGYQLCREVQSLFARRILHRACPADPGPVPRPLRPPRGGPPADLARRVRAADRRRNAGRRDRQRRLQGPVGHPIRRRRRLDGRNAGHLPARPRQRDRPDAPDPRRTAPRQPRARGGLV
jgi:CubicO group peptidase (beta-lactamase class C family)